MINLLSKWLVVALSFLLAAYIVPGIFVASFVTALILAVVWGILSFTIKPILLILTLPINLITLGLFTFVINALLFYFLGNLVQGFDVAGFKEAFLGSLVVYVASWIGTKIFVRND